jgi:uncharacterized membrane protein
MKIKVTCDLCTVLHQASNQSETVHNFLQAASLPLIMVGILGVAMGIYYYAEKKWNKHKKRR